MAINRPDIYQHNNPDNAIADSDFVRGGGRVVPDLPGLYALSSKSDQLKVRVTRVWVTGLSSYYVLVDASNIGNAAGWLADGGSNNSAVIGNYVSGEVLNSGTPVVINAVDGKVYKFDRTNTAHYENCIGVTTTSVAINTPVQVLSSGELNQYTSLTTGSTYYCGDSPGTITSTIPTTTGTIQKIGVAKNATTLSIDIKTIVSQL